MELGHAMAAGRVRGPDPAPGRVGQRGSGPLPPAPWRRWWHEGGMGVGPPRRWGTGEAALNPNCWGEWDQARSDGGDAGKQIGGVGTRGVGVQDRMLGSVPSSPLGGGGGSGPGPKAAGSRVGGVSLAQGLYPHPPPSRQQSEWAGGTGPAPLQQGQHCWPRPPNPAGDSDRADRGVAGPAALAFSLLLPAGHENGEDRGQGKARVTGQAPQYCR